jgi:MarR family transcriptional regulator, transcriptional regulator for hemolysin
MSEPDYETLGPLVHGTARAWRLKLDERLKPMGLSQAKWRTLLHLSLAPGALTQTEIAARLGIEEPSLVTLLHRLESERWVARRGSPHDRRCKIVYLGRRAQRIITQINAAADELRHELLADIPASELQTCIKVLARIRGKAEKHDKLRRNEMSPVYPGGNGQNRDAHPITNKKALRGATRKSK